MIKIGIVLLVLLLSFIAWVFSGGFLGKDTRSAMPNGLGVLSSLIVGVVLLLTNWAGVTGLFDREDAQVIEPESERTEIPTKLPISQRWRFESNNGWANLYSPASLTEGYMKIGCQPNLSTPHLALEIFLPSEDDDIRALHLSLKSEWETTTRARFAFLIGSTLQFNVDMDPGAYDEEGRLISWIAPVEGPLNDFSIQPAVARFVSAALTREGIITVVAKRSSINLPIMAEARGLQEIEDEFQVLKDCITK